MVGRMRLVSDQKVIEAAMRVQEVIIHTYMGPNRSAPELIAFAEQGGFQFLNDFSEACRADLAARTTAVR